MRGSGRRIRTFIACFKDRQPTVSRSPSIPDDVSISSALRESNPPCRLGRPAPLPLGQGHAHFLRAAVAGIEPASGRLTAACPYQHRPHRIDHPTTSIAQTVLKSTQRELNRAPPARVVRPPWRGGRPPLPHGCIVGKSNCQRAREHRVRLELTLPHYGCGVLAAERPVLVRRTSTSGIRGT